MFKVCASKKQVVAPSQNKEKTQDASKDASQCLCHKIKGLPGWCGVAGGGVPACDH